MRSMIVVALFLVCGSFPAVAQIDPVPDGIGIYADLEATQISISAEPGVITPVYLMITNVNAPSGVGCWAAQIVVPPNAEILAWNFPGWCMNVANPPHFVVALGNFPLPQAPIIRVMTFFIRMSDNQPGYFYVTGTPEAGLPIPDPVFLEYDDVNTIHVLHSYPNGIEQPAFAVNGTLTPTEAATWGGVKALFQ